MLDKYREMSPVIYGEDAIKYMMLNNWPPGKSCFKMHWHERMEILYVIDGSLEVHDLEDFYCLKPGQIAVFGPGQLHQGIAGPDGVTYHVFMFDAEMFNNSTLGARKYMRWFIQGNVKFQHCIEDEELTQILERLVSLVNGVKKVSPLVTIGVIYEALGLLYAYGIEDNHIANQQDKGFGKVLEYVSEHYTEKISPKMLSEKFGYNETYFCRRFKEVTGLTFSKYLLVLRMEMAENLLRKTKDDIGIISWKCGFEDRDYFSRCFRKRYDCSPTEFRKMEGDSDE